MSDASRHAHQLGPLDFHRGAGHRLLIVFRQDIGRFAARNSADLLLLNHVANGSPAKPNDADNDAQDDPAPDGFRQGSNQADKKADNHSGD